MFGHNWIYLWGEYFDQTGYAMTPPLSETTSRTLEKVLRKRLTSWERCLYRRRFWNCFVNVRERLGDPVTKLNAATLLATRGSAGDLLKLLDSPDVNIRSQVMLYR
jgi:hypothetical protein